MRQREIERSIVNRYPLVKKGMTELKDLLEIWCSRQAVLACDECRFKMECDIVSPLDGSRRNG